MIADNDARASVAKHGPKLDRDELERQKLEHFLRWHKGRHIPIVEREGGDSDRALKQGFDEVLKYRQIFERDSSGHVDRMGRRKAIAQRNALLQAQGMNPNMPFSNVKLSSNNHTSDSSLYSLTWTENGPFNIPGRTLSIAIHPTQPNKVWIGTADGGIWSTNNGGVTWNNISDWLPSMAISSIVFDPNNLNTMYAGTGEGYLNADAVQGAGLLQSTDGGVTFNLMPSTAAWGNVDAIVVSPLNSKVILAGVGGIGIVRSTDGGLTWKTTYGSQGQPYCITANPNIPTQLLASGYDGANSNYVIRSTDGGITWNPVEGIGTVSGWLSRIQVAYAPSNTTLAYAVVGDSGGDSSNGTIWRSSDSGKNWVLRGYDANVDWYRAPLWIDPTNPDIVVTGSIDCYISTDGGVTSNQISYWPAWSVGGMLPHADMHFFASDPNYNGKTNRKFYIATDGGLFVTNDIYNATPFSGWNAFTIGVRSTQYYGGIGEATSGFLIGGTQDNGSLVNTFTNTQSFQEYGGDGGFADIDPINPDNHYGEYVYLEMFRSQDGGQTAQDLSGLIPDAGVAANFIAPFVLDPNNQNTLYAGGYRLWSCLNITAAKPTFAQVRAGGTDLLSAIAVAVGDSNTVWVGQNDGGVSKTVNATATTPTWTTINLPSNGRAIGRIAIDPNNENNVYVGLGGFEAGNILVTHDGGVTWTTATGVSGAQIPAAPVMGLVVDPTNSNYLYAGTEVGLFWSQDAGAHWSTANAGPCTAEVDEVRFVKNTPEQLVIATHGRGVWTALTGVTPNHPPVIAPIANSTLNQGQTISFQIPGSDPDAGQTLTYNFVGTPPPGAAMTSGGHFSWTVPYTAYGAYPITVTATDNGYPAMTSAPVTFTITVQEVNQAPVIVNPGLLNATPGGTVTYPITAYDVDYPVTTPILLSVASGPSFASVSGLNLVLNLPANQKIAQYQITLKATEQGHNPAGLYATATFTIRVNNAALGTFTVAPTFVVGGTATTGTLTLTSPAPAAGLTVKLSSDSYSSPPATVFFPNGSASQSFSIPTTVVSKTVFSYLSASYGGTSLPAKILVYPPAVSSLSLSPSTVTGGTSVTATVTLSATAPKGGVVVALSSSSPYAASVPASLTVPAGAQSATFTITTTDPAVQQQVTIKAATNGGSQTAVLTVNH